MSIQVCEQPRPYQFELRYLYGLNTGRQHLMDWLHRVARRIEIAFSVIYLCVFGSVLLFAIAAGNTKPAFQPAPPPIVNSEVGPVYEPPLIPSAGQRAALWETVSVPSPCCALVTGAWTAIIEETRR
ncbi:MAG: hypothetical protein WBX25_05555 [Rhodomicrobium sp.]